MCESGFECATLEVPLDYTDPAGDTIDLALLRVPATGDRIGSLVVNPGGPGAPGTDYAAQAESALRRPLLDAYDVVGFDPRGTGDSSPVDCLSDDDLDAYLAQDPDPDSAGRGRRVRRRADAYARGATSCRMRSPVTSRRSRQPATWTSCGPRWGRRA